MRTTSIVILAIVLFASTNALTAQDMIRAVNFARRNPLIIRDRIKALYPNMDGIGVADPTCYADAIKFLSVQSPIHVLAESITADLSTWNHSKYCVTVLNKMSHAGFEGSGARDRLEDLGNWQSCSWAYNENMAITYKKDTSYTSADEVVIMWIADCKVLGRGHRANVFDRDVSHLGCGVFQGPMTKNGVPMTGTVYTCNGVTRIALKEESKAKLAEAGLSLAKNDVEFTGV